MHRIICSTGALLGRPNGRDFYLMKDCVNRLTCDGYELLMYDTWYDRAEELAKFFASLSIAIPFFHCEKRIGELFSLRGPGDWEEGLRKFEINCELAAFLHAGDMVLHLWDGPVSDRFFANNLEIYPRLRRIAAAHGIRLLVENVVCNRLDPLTHWAELKSRYPDALFILDTKMAAFHGQLDTVYTEGFKPYWENHIRHLHINDYGGDSMDWQNLKTLHVGQGHIDFERFFAYLRTIGYQGDYTVEATSFLPDGIINIDALNNTFAYIRAHI